MANVISTLLQTFQRVKEPCSVSVSEYHIFVFDSVYELRIRKVRVDGLAEGRKVTGRSPDPVALQAFLQHHLERAVREFWVTPARSENDHRFKRALTNIEEGVSMPIGIKWAA